jgi:flagellar hook-basal body complex protein FliE
MIDGVKQSVFPAVTAATSSSAKPADAQKSFAAFLKDAINQVNDEQIKADQLTEKLVKGENVDLHQVMIASQKASISLQLTLEIRNKVIEAYQEMMRMQV